MKDYEFKKVDGYSSVIINNIDNLKDINQVNILDLYWNAQDKYFDFLINENGRFIMWGLFNVAEYMGISDVSKAYPKNYKVKEIDFPPKKKL